jgi:hypothetical protein
MNNWTPCPRCNSPRVRASAGWVDGLFFVIIVLICLAIPSLIAKVIAIPFALLALVAFFKVPTKNSYHCRDCGYSWRDSQLTTDH